MKRKNTVVNIVPRKETEKAPVMLVFLPPRTSKPAKCTTTVRMIRLTRNKTREKISLTPSGMSPHHESARSIPIKEDAIVKIERLEVMLFT
jgi:hypothetical protein